MAAASCFHPYWQPIGPSHGPRLACFRGICPREFPAFAAEAFARKCPSRQHYCSASARTWQELWTTRDKPLLNFFVIGVLTLSRHSLPDNVEASLETLQPTATSTEILGAENECKVLCLLLQHRPRYRNISGPCIDEPLVKQLLNIFKSNFAYTLRARVLALLGLGLYVAFVFEQGTQCAPWYAKLIRDARLLLAILDVLYCSEAKAFVLAGPQASPLLHVW